MIVRSIGAALTASFLLTAAAEAQDGSAKKLPGAAKLPDTVRLPDLRLPGTDPDPVTVRGCILSETFNTQSVTDYSMQFRIMTPTGPEMFNFTGDYIVRANPSSFSLATSAETLRWARIMEALERAAQSNRIVDVSYDNRNQRVFGISINWQEACATP